MRPIFQVTIALSGGRHPSPHATVPTKYGVTGYVVRRISFRFPDAYKFFIAGLRVPGKRVYGSSLSQGPDTILFQAALSRFFRVIDWPEKDKCSCF